MENKITFTSKTMITTKSGEQLPKFKIEQGDGYYTISCFNEKKQKYHDKILTRIYIVDHLDYLFEHDPDRIQRYLDNGKLYKYLRDIHTTAIVTVDRQMEKWKKTDREYLIAREKGDLIEQARILNNMQARAKEIMYPCVIYA